MKILSIQFESWLLLLLKILIRYFMYFGIILWTSINNSDYQFLANFLLRMKVKVKLLNFHKAVKKLKIKCSENKCQVKKKSNENKVDCNVFASFLHYVQTHTYSFVLRFSISSRNVKYKVQYSIVKWSKYSIGICIRCRYEARQ